MFRGPFFSGHGVESDLDWKSKRLMMYIIAFYPSSVHLCVGQSPRKKDAHKSDALNQWCLRMQLGNIMWYHYHHVWNAEVIRTTSPNMESPPFGHITRIPDETDAKKTASSYITEGDHQDILVIRTWIMTIFQNLKQITST